MRITYLVIQTMAVGWVDNMSQIKIHINGSEELTLVSSDKLEIQSLLQILDEHIKPDVKLNANVLNHETMKSWRLFSNKERVK